MAKWEKVWKGKSEREVIVANNNAKDTDYMVGYCEMCELHFDTEHLLWQHMSGKNHVKSLKALQAGRPMPKKVQERKEVQGVVPEEVDKQSYLEWSLSTLSKDEPVVGLNFVVEYFDSIFGELCYCEMCNSKASTTSMALHITGYKHRLNFLKFCDRSRYTKVKKRAKRSITADQVKALCRESEKEKGRGRIRVLKEKPTTLERKSLLFFHKNHSSQQMNESKGIGESSKETEMVIKVEGSTEGAGRDTGVKQTVGISKDAADKLPEVSSSTDIVSLEKSSLDGKASSDHLARIKLSPDSRCMVQDHDAPDSSFKDKFKKDGGKGDSSGAGDRDRRSHYRHRSSSRSVSPRRRRDDSRPRHRHAHHGPHRRHVRGSDRRDKGLDRHDKGSDKRDAKSDRHDKGSDKHDPGPSVKLVKGSIGRWDKKTWDKKSSEKSDKDKQQREPDQQQACPVIPEASTGTEATMEVFSSEPNKTATAVEVTKTQPEDIDQESPKTIESSDPGPATKAVASHSIPQETPLTLAAKSLALALQKIQAAVPNQPMPATQAVSVRIPSQPLSASQSVSAHCSQQLQAASPGLPVSTSQPASSPSASVISQSTSAKASQPDPVAEMPGQQQLAQTQPWSDVRVTQFSILQPMSTAPTIVVRRRMLKQEKLDALMALKDKLVEEFTARCMDTETVKRAVVDRFEAYKNYTKRRVPFDLAMQRILDYEDRWMLLLEFERQTLPFEVAEERTDRRMELLKLLRRNGCPSQEALFRVLDMEVVKDFRMEFEALGLDSKLAHKQAEKRLWMLEHFSHRGVSPEEASKCVLAVEAKLKEAVGLVMVGEDPHADSERGPPTWEAIVERAALFIFSTSQTLCLTAKERQLQLDALVEELMTCRASDMTPEEAIRNVLIARLPYSDFAGDCDMQADNEVAVTDAVCAASTEVKTTSDSEITAAVTNTASSAAASTEVKTISDSEITAAVMDTASTAAASTEVKTTTASTAAKPTTTKEVRVTAAVSAPAARIANTEAKTTITAAAKTATAVATKISFTNVAKTTAAISKISTSAAKTTTMSTAKKRTIDSNATSINTTAAKTTTAIAAVTKTHAAVVAPSDTASSIYNPATSSMCEASATNTSATTSPGGASNSASTQREVAKQLLDLITKLRDTKELAVDSTLSNSAIACGFLNLIAELGRRGGGSRSTMNSSSKTKKRLLLLAQSSNLSLLSQDTQSVTTTTASEDPKTNDKPRSTRGDSSSSTDVKLLDICELLKGAKKEQVSSLIKSVVGGKWNDDDDATPPKLNFTSKPAMSRIPGTSPILSPESSPQYGDCSSPATSDVSTPRRARSRSTSRHRTKRDNNPRKTGSRRNRANRSGSRHRSTSRTRRKRRDLTTNERSRSRSRDRRGPDRSTSRTCSKDNMSGKGRSGRSHSCSRNGKGAGDTTYNKEGHSTDRRGARSGNRKGRSISRSTSREKKDKERSRNYGSRSRKDGRRSRKRSRRLSSGDSNTSSNAGKRQKPARRSTSYDSISSDSISSKSTKTEQPLTVPRQNARTEQSSIVPRQNPRTEQPSIIPR